MKLSAGIASNLPGGYPASYINSEIVNLNQVIANVFMAKHQQAANGHKTIIKDTCFSEELSKPTEPGISFGWAGTKIRM